MHFPSISITSLVANEMKGDDKWDGSVRGADGCIYGVPFCARRVLKFNPADNSTTFIGPDLGDGKCKWSGGTLANNGSIYCNPFHSDKVLKIDTISQAVTLLDAALPESGDCKWASGACATDGNIYCMPCTARSILKINSSNDAVSSVGVGEDDTDILEISGFKFLGTVVAGNDHCVYGIPHDYWCVLKFDHRNQRMTEIGAMFDGPYKCGSGTVGRDGRIYALSDEGFLLTMDVTIAENEYYNDMEDSCTEWMRAFTTYEEGANYGDGILGDDGCIYWPPVNACQVLKFDPGTSEAAPVEGVLNGIGKWTSGASALNGVIYCLPSFASQILAIDSSQEFRRLLKDGMERHPENLGNLFELRVHEYTEYECAVAKYGPDKTFQIIKEFIPLNSVCERTNLYSFMVAASCRNCDVDVIYFLLRGDPSFIISCGDKHERRLGDSLNHFDGC